MKLVKKLTFALVATLAVSTLTACSLYTGIPGRDGKEKSRRGRTQESK